MLTRSETDTTTIHDGRVDEYVCVDVCCKLVLQVSKVVNQVCRCVCFVIKTYVFAIICCCQTKRFGFKKAMRHVL